MYFPAAQYIYANIKNLKPYLPILKEASHTQKFWVDIEQFENCIYYIIQ